MSAEKAKIVREFLKSEYGITSREVSVRSEGLTISSSISARIKATHTKKGLPIAKSLVEKALDKVRHVRYCEYTHEILGGGNTFTHVSYDDQALRSFVGEDTLEAIKALPKNPGMPIKVFGGFEVFFVDRYFHVSGGPGHTEKCWDAETALKNLGRRMLEKEAASRGL